MITADTLEFMPDPNLDHDEHGYTVIGAFANFCHSWRQNYSAKGESSTLIEGGQLSICLNELKGLILTERNIATGIFGDEPERRKIDGESFFRANFSEYGISPKNIDELFRDCCRIDGVTVSVIRIIKNGDNLYFNAEVKPFSYVPKYLNEWPELNFRRLGPYVRAEKLMEFLAEKGEPERDISTVKRYFDRFAVSEAVQALMRQKFSNRDENIDAIIEKIREMHWVFEPNKKGSDLKISRQTIIDNLVPESS